MPQRTRTHAHARTHAHFFHPSPFYAPSALRHTSTRPLVAPCTPQNTALPICLHTPPSIPIGLSVVGAQPPLARPSGCGCTHTHTTKHELQLRKCSSHPGWAGVDRVLRVLRAGGPQGEGLGGDCAMGSRGAPRVGGRSKGERTGRETVVSSKQNRPPSPLASPSPSPRWFSSPPCQLIKDPSGSRAEHTQTKCPRPSSRAPTPPSSSTMTGWTSRCVLVLEQLCIMRMRGCSGGPGDTRGSRSGMEAARAGAMCTAAAAGVLSSSSPLGLSLSLLSRMKGLN